MTGDEDRLPDEQLVDRGIARQVAAASLSDKQSAYNPYDLELSSWRISHARRRQDTVSILSRLQIDAFTDV